MQRKPPVGLKLSSYNNSSSNTASANSSPGPLTVVSNNSAPKLGNMVTSAVRPETAQPSGVKRSSPFPSQPLHHLSTNTTHHHHHQSKKHKLSHSYRDVSIADAGKFGSLNEFAFFDKVNSYYEYSI